MSIRRVLHAAVSRLPAGATDPATIWAMFDAAVALPHRDAAARLARLLGRSSLYSDLFCGGDSDEAAAIVRDRLSRSSHVPPDSFFEDELSPAFLRVLPGLPDSLSFAGIVGALERDADRREQSWQVRVWRGLGEDLDWPADGVVRSQSLAERDLLEQLHREAMSVAAFPLARAYARALGYDTEIYECLMGDLMPLGEFIAGLMAEGDAPPPQE